MLAGKRCDLSAGQWDGGSYPPAFDSQEQKHDLQKSVPVVDFLDQQPSQLEQTECRPKAEKSPPPLFRQASSTTASQ